MLLLFSIVITLVAWYISSNHLTEKTRNRFEYRVHDIHSAIQARMGAYEQVLRSTVGLFNSGDTVTGKEFKQYVKTLDLSQTYPGIQGLGYTIRIDSGDIEFFTKKMRSRGFPDFKVWPEEPRSEYFSIIFLEPADERNQRALGFDMYTEENRKTAMLRARKTGRPALSEMVTLVQETNRDVQKGCLLYLPVYDRNSDFTTEEERYAALIGFVYSPFRINDLMNGILGSVANEIEFEIYDGNNTDIGNLFYASHGYNAKKEKANYSLQKKLDVAGHNWTLIFTSRKSFISTYEQNQPNIIALAGIIVNLLLLLILIKLHSLSKRNKILAERYKAEKDRYEIVSESTNDIIWEWNLEKNIVSFNKNFQLVIGSPIMASELPFNNWIDHFHPDDKEHLIQRLNSFIKSDRNFWSDEYRLMKKDGRIVYILDRGRIIRDADKKPLSIVGSMINISERKKAEESQQKFNEQLEKTVLLRTIELQRSNDDLERFAHIASHDLKEPVRKMLVFTDQLKTKYEHQLGDGVKLLDKLTRSTRRLNQMIESILKFSIVSYESHNAEPVDLNTTVRNVCEDLELIINEKNAQVRFDQLPVIEGSTVLLHQLFYNLINNSLKFSKNDIEPIIDIHSKILVRNRKELVEIIFSDNGIGFNQADANKIFQSFVRLHPKDKFEGTGLGLALCKKIVERHGGYIEANSVIGQGATFIITLPVKQQGGTI